MKWSYQEVPKEQLFWENSPFDWQVKADLKALEHSLKINGFLMPLMVQSRKKHQFCLVDGFKRRRLLALQEEPSDSYPCWVIPQEVPLHQVALLRLHTLECPPELKGLAIYRILANLAQMEVAPPILMEHVLPKLGLKPSKKLMQDLMKLGSLVEEMTGKDSVFLENYTVENLLPLLKFSETEIPLILNKLKGLSLGGNKWKTLLELLKEVSRLQKQSLSQIMESDEVVQILQDSNIQPPVQFRLLKQHLTMKRYPELTATRTAFEQAIQTLKLPPQSSLHYDPFFEKEELLLKMQVHSLEELHQQFESISPHLKAKTWENLFQLIQGEELL